MTSRVWLVGSASLIALMVTLAIVSSGGSQLAGPPAASAAEKQGEKPSALPPLVVKQDAPLLDEPKQPAGEKLCALPPLVIKNDAPLLLDEPAKPAPKAGGATAGKVANNESCYCCHTNYREEEFVGYHAKENIGCIQCHGESLAHRNDEDNITPPDTIYAADQIERNCKECHDTHDAPAAKVITRWQEKCPARTDPKDLLCTDCHGQHRLRFRSVWWDKKTRELGPRAEGERIRMAPDLTKVPGKASAAENP